MNKTVSNILEKEMDRKEFFKFAGGAMLLLTGIAGMTKSLKSLHSGQNSIKSGNKTSAAGYGGSAYGKSQKV